MALAIEEKNLPKRGEYVISVENIDILPCSLELSVIEIVLVNVMNRELVLKVIVDEIKIEYDYIIIDCSLSLGMHTINDLAACSSMIILVTPQYLSAKGLELLLKKIVKVKKE